MSAVRSVLASAVALTTAATASTKTAKCKAKDKHSVYVYWTPGTTNNVLALTFEFSPDGTNWTQDMQLGDSSGAKVRQPNSFSHTATGTTVTGFRFDFSDVLAEELRVKYSESEAGSSTKGTISVQCLSSSSAHA